MFPQKALKLPKNSQAEKELRDQAMQDGLKTAVGVPMTLAKKTNSIWEPLLHLAECGNINCKSDLQAIICSFRYSMKYHNILMLL